MQNWPKYKKTFWQSVQIGLTKKFLQLVDSIENPKIKFIESLKLEAKYGLYLDDHELIACPDELEISLDRVCFSDLFLSDEFQKLHQGLRSLLSKYSFSIDYSDEKRLDTWFGSLYSSKFKLGSSISVGSLVFNKKSGKTIKFLKSGRIHLTYIAPSFIVLSIFVWPSDEFIQRFISITKKKSFPESKISFNLRNRIISWSRISPAQVRVAEIEELFLELNKSVVLLFRKTFDVLEFGLI